MHILIIGLGNQGKRIRNLNKTDKYITLDPHKLMLISNYKEFH